MNVTDTELIEFMVSRNINYKKTKNNKPDMRCKFNKEYRNLLRKNKILEKNKKENLHSFTSEKEMNYRKEIVNMSDIIFMIVIHYRLIFCDPTFDF